MTEPILDTLRTAHDAQVLALAIVNTIPDPFLVLDEGLHVLAASRAFYDVFRVDAAETQGRSLFALGDGQWNIPALRHLLETIIPDRVAMDGFEVSHDFPGLGLRIMLLNARKVIYADSPAITILLAFRDVTDIRLIESEKAALLARAEQLLAQKQMLLEEMPYYRISGAVPDAVVGLLSSMPVLKPVIPDPGIRFQLVHEDDVASAFVAGVRGLGEPGAYNLAGNGTVRMADVADELGWYSVPVPEPVVGFTAGLVDRLPLAPESVSWIHAVRRPVLMKTDHAREALKWKPEHTAKATLKQMVAARRAGAPAAR